MILEGPFAQLYALVLVAIARADGEITLDEGLRLQRILDARIGDATRIEDLMMADLPTPDDLAEQVRGDPFRGRAVHPLELATRLVTDALDVALAKGHVASEELATLRQFVVALGFSDAELRRMAGPHAAWLPE